MTTRTNVSVVGFVRGFVNFCCGDCRLMAVRMGFVSASVLLWANAGQAQVVFPAGEYWAGGGVGTAESAFEHGAADIIRSEGLYNLNTAKGIVEAEKARAIYLENKKTAFQGYLVGKEQRSAINAQKRELSRHSAEALAVAGKSDVKPLNGEQLNPVTGKIKWPKALLDSKFSAKRNEIEKLFELQAKTSEGSNNQSKIQAATSELATMLKSNITYINSTDYMNARKFIDSLTVSASQS
jgi:hypothetical protein